MTPDTLASEAGFNVRARKAIRRLLPGTPAFPNPRLSDVANLSRGKLLAQRNCGDSTVKHISEVLLKAGLYLIDDTPGLWPSLREGVTALFLKKAETDPAAVVRALCDHAMAHDLATVAQKMGLILNEDDTDGEVKGPREEGGSGEGRPQQGEADEEGVGREAGGTAEAAPAVQGTEAGQDDREEADGHA